MRSGMPAVSVIFAMLMVSSVLFQIAGAPVLPAAESHVPVTRAVTSTDLRAEAGTLTVPSSAAASDGGLKVYWQWTAPGNSSVSSISYAPDGSAIAVGASRFSNRSLYLLQASNGSLLNSLDNGNDTLAVRFSPDGDLLAAGGNGFGIRVYDIAQNWSMIAQREVNAMITELSWSADGRYLSGARSAGNGLNSSLVTYDSTANWSAVAALTKDFGTRNVLSVSWDSTSSRLAAGLASAPGADAYIYALNGSAVKSWSCNSADCRQVQFGPDPTFALIGRGTRTGDPDLWVWNTTGNTSSLSQYTGHANQVAIDGVAWSPDGSRAASGGTGAGLHIWRTGSGAQLDLLATGNVLDTSFSPNGTQLAVAESTFRVSLWGDAGLPTVTQVQILAPDRGTLPFTPNFVKAERITIRVWFSEDMNQSGTVSATYGATAPYNANTATPVGWSSPNTWDASTNLTSGMPNGQYGINVTGTATDLIGQVMVGNDTGRFWLDTEAPSMTLSPPPSYWSTTATTTLNATATDASPANSSGLAFIERSYRYNNNENTSWGNLTGGGTAAINGTSWSGAFQVDFSSGQGHYEFAFKSYDRSSNAATVATSALMGRDTQNPFLQVSSPGGMWRRVSSVNYTMSATDGVGLASVLLVTGYSADNVNWSYVRTAIPVSGKAWNRTDVHPTTQDGRYRIRGNVTDLSGRTATEQGQGALFGVDRNAPTSSVTPLPPVVNTTVVQILYTTQDSVSGVNRTQLDVRKDGGNWVIRGNSTQPNGQFNFNSANAGGDGLYEFRVRARDRALNEYVPAANQTWTRIDSVAPLLVATAPTNGAQNAQLGVRPAAVFSEPVTGTLRLLLDLNLVAGTTTFTGATGVFAPNAPLLPKRDYRFEMTVEDAAGNTFTGFIVFATVDGVPDTTPPKVVSTDPVDFSIVTQVNTVTILFNEAMDPGTSTSVSVTPGSVSNATLAADQRTLTFSIAGQVADSTYKVTIAAATAHDLANNALDGNGDGIGGDDGVFEFTVSATAIPAVIMVQVVDSSGAALQGAQVTLIRAERNVSQIDSDASGTVTFDKRAPGDYTVRAEKSGMQAASADVSVAAGETKTVTLTLTPVGGTPGPTTPEGPNAALIGGLVAALVVVGLVLFLIMKRRGRRCPSCLTPLPVFAGKCPKCGANAGSRPTGVTPTPVHSPIESPPPPPPDSYQPQVEASDDAFGPPGSASDPVARRAAIEQARSGRRP